MANQLRPVGLEFADTAPVRLTFTETVSAEPRAVYAALAEDVESLPSWFSAVTFARSTEDGRGREVRLRGGIHFLETVMAADSPERYAYRIDTSSAPFISAMLEDWRLEPEGSVGTRVRWTMAVDAPLPLRLLLRLVGPGVAVSFRDAMRALDRRLAGSAGKP